MIRKLRVVLGALLLLAGVAFWWLLIDNRHGDARPKPLHIAELRQLAASLPGPAPDDVEAEVTTLHHQLGDLYAAGSGLKRRALAKIAYRLPVSGPTGKQRGAIMIDSGLTVAEASAEGFRYYDADAQARIDTGLRGAGLILFTLEHIDRMGGLLDVSGRPDGAGVLARARFNPAQLPPAPLAAALPWPAGATPAPTIAPSGAQAVAPGVVVIPAPGHTPGSQLIFVRTRDGHEYLFAGDIAPLAANWQELRGRSHLAGDLIAHENRAEVYSWLLTLRQLASEDPGLIIVPGHDYDWLMDAMDQGLIAEHFDHRPPH